MSASTSRLDGYRPHALALLRIVVGYLFFLHGGAKLLGGVEWVSLAGLATILELVGGALIVLGLHTRLTAFILSGQMAAAYFIAHATADTFLLPFKNRGDAAVLFCFIFLYFVFSGGGAWALDNVRKRRARRTLSAA